MKDISRISDRVAVMVSGSVRLKWDITRTDKSGADFQIIWDSGSRFVKFTDIVKAEKELQVRILTDLARVSSLGLSLNRSRIIRLPSDVIIDDGKVKLVMTVSIFWLSGIMIPERDDIEELMMEAGLL